MRAIAERADDNVRAVDARNKIERDIDPLGREIRRALNELGREELFYQPPDIERGGGGTTGPDYGQMDSLIQSSDDLLRESQAVLSETEEIGTGTIHQMGRQREQLENANQHVVAVMEVAIKARSILTGMSRRALKSKVCLYAIIAALGSANLYVLYLIYMKNFHRGHDSLNH